MVNLVPTLFIFYVLPHSVNINLCTAWLGASDRFAYPDPRSLTRLNGITSPVTQALCP